LGGGSLLKLHAQALLVTTTDPATFGEDVARELAGYWYAAAGNVRAEGVTVDIHAWPDGLRLDAYADTEAELSAAERALSDLVTRMGAGTIEWHTRPSTVPGAPPPVMPVYNFPGGDDEDL
jgi:hypothetical protein